MLTTLMGVWQSQAAAYSIFFIAGVTLLEKKKSQTWASFISSLLNRGDPQVAIEDFVTPALRLTASGGAERWRTPPAPAAAFHRLFIRPLWCRAPLFVLWNCIQYARTRGRAGTRCSCVVKKKKKISSRGRRSVDKPQPLTLAVTARGQRSPTDLPEPHQSQRGPSETARFDFVTS